MLPGRDALLAGAIWRNRTEIHRSMRLTLIKDTVVCAGCSCSCRFNGMYTLRNSRLMKPCFTGAKLYMVYVYTRFIVCRTSWRWSEDEQQQVHI